MAYRRHCYRCNDRREFSKVSGTTYKCRSCGMQVQHDPSKRDVAWKNDPDRINAEQKQNKINYRNSSL